jgi:hypothetical protein
VEEEVAGEVLAEVAEEVVTARGQDRECLIPSYPVPTSSMVSGLSVMKFHSDGSLAQYKVRWVVRGFAQEHVIDYDETFSPVVKPSIIWVVLSLAFSFSWPIS